MRCGANPVHERRVELFHLHDWPYAPVFRLRSHFVQEPRPVAFNVLSAVMLREAEIQRPSAVAGRNAARPGAESVRQPR